MRSKKSVLICYDDEDTHPTPERVQLGELAALKSRFQLPPPTRDELVGDTRQSVRYRDARRERARKDAEIAEALARAKEKRAADGEVRWATSAHARAVQSGRGGVRRCKGVCVRAGTR